jgi:hypothetical protein
VNSRTLRIVALAAVGFCLTITCTAAAQCGAEPSTGVQGTVSAETTGAPGPAPGAKVTLWGDFTFLTAVADRDGKFHFSNVDPGTYLIEATYFDLRSEQKITVEDGIVLQVSLLLKVAKQGSAPRP